MRCEAIVNQQPCPNAATKRATPPVTGRTQHLCERCWAVFVQYHRGTTTEVIQPEA